MKNKIRIIYYVLNTIIFILSLLFLFIELRLILSFDWSIYQYPLFSSIQYISRFLLSLMICTLTFIPFINIKRRKRNLTYISWIGSISILIFGIISSFFATNYFGEIFLILSCLYFVVSMIYYRKVKTIIRKKY